MKRRDFMTGLGMAAALPAISRAQQAIPTIGFLSTRSPDEATIHTDAFRRGLEGMGYVEGRSIAIEYRPPGPAGRWLIARIKAEAEKD